MAFAMYNLSPTGSNDRQSVNKKVLVSSFKYTISILLSEIVEVHLKSGDTKEVPLVLFCMEVLLLRSCTT
jgi:hypothetical protein